MKKTLMPPIPSHLPKQLKLERVPSLELPSPSISDYRRSNFHRVVANSLEEVDGDHSSQPGFLSHPANLGAGLGDVDSGAVG
jgi:hypothetical protein